MNTTDLASLLQSGFEQHRAGNLAAAEALYRQALQADPRQSQAWYLLGALALDAGQPAASVELISRAVRLDGGRAAYHATLAQALYRLDRAADAIASCRQAIQLDRGQIEARNMLGTILQGQGDLHGARECFAEIARIAPTNADAQHNLGVIAQLHQQWPTALEHYRTATRLNPRHAQAHAAVGQVLHLQGKSAEAVPAFEAAIAAQPDWAVGHCGLGVAQHACGDFFASLTSFRKAVELAPNFAEAHYNLGTTLRELNRPEEAVPCFKAAIRLQPLLIDAHVNLASTLRVLALPDAAVEASRRAVALAPQLASAHAHLAGALQSQGDMEGTLAAYRRAVELDPKDAATHSNLLYTLNFHPETRTEDLFAKHQAWAQRHAEPLTALASPHDNPRDPNRRLRVGYVSSHFREHAVSFFAEPLIETHDPDAVEVFLYADVRHPDAVTERLRGHVHAWRDIAGQKDEAVAQRVRADKIDILVDLAGHIGGNRLLTFARKPAPIQVTYLGYQNTTGMTAMDYRLTDGHADPEGVTDRFYTEKLVRLPESFFCFAAPTNFPVAPLPALARGHVTFASLNHVQKLTHRALDVWMRILRAVPNARLMVLAYPGGQFERVVRDVATRQGIDPSRIWLENNRPRGDYLRLHDQIDVALDSFPFNGHTTVCDALWMGVPSIMMEGSCYAARFGGSVLQVVGLSDWIVGGGEMAAGAEDCRATGAEDRYIERAVAAAADLPALAALRGGLRQRMAKSSLLDAGGFARGVEAAYRTMWQDWCRSGG